MKKPNITIKPIAWLKPYDKNVKIHPEEQVERLAKTISRFGWDQPIVAEGDGTIIKGHGRRLAALSLGLTEVPVWVRDDLTREEADAARIADNAVISTQFDTRGMQEELKRLLSMSEITFDMDDIGLSEKDKDFMIRQLDELDPEAILNSTSAEIEEMKAEDARKLDESDDEMIPIGKAMGFAKMRKADQRIWMAFIAEAEAATGKMGYEAFVAGMKLIGDRGLS